MTYLAPSIMNNRQMLKKCAWFFQIRSLDQPNISQDISHCVKLPKDLFVIQRQWIGDHIMYNLVVYGHEDLCSRENKIGKFW